MTTAGRKALLQRARPFVLEVLMGEVATSLVVLLAVPLAVALAFGHAALSLRLGLVLVPVLAAAGWARRRRGAALPPVHGIEALVVSALTFAVAALLGWWPLMITGLTPLQGLFEAVSAVTSTGLTMTRRLEAEPFAVLFMRHWFQWYGGFAIIVLAVGLVFGHGGIARRIGALDIDDASRLESVRTRSRRILAVYAGATAVAWLLLLATMEDAGAALLFALSAVATGGFAPTATSLGGETVPTAVVVLALCLFGAISFDQWVRTGQGGWRAVVRDTETRQMLAFVLVMGALVALAETLAGSGFNSGHAWAHAISAQTTAGFTTQPVAELSEASRLLLIAAMFVGGDVGSTAGGFKLVRLVVLAGLLRVVWLRIASGPRSVMPLEAKGHRVEAAELENITALALAMLLVLLLAWLVFLLHGAPPLPALFDVTSALATAGLSAGVIGPELPASLTAVAIALMWLGRVELFAVIILCLPATWRPARS